MFDFLAQDDCDALVADYQEHGHYRNATLSKLKTNVIEVNVLLSSKGYPSIAQGKETKKKQPTEIQVDALLETVVQSKADKSPPPVGKTSSPATLLDKQRTALSYILDYHDKRPIRAKLKDINVTTHEYQEWLNEGDFQKILRKELDIRFKNLDIDAKLGLSKLILEGDLNAIKYYYEFTGLYRPSTESQINLTVILAKLMDVLVKHVEPESLDIIANEIERSILSGSSQG